MPTLALMALLALPAQTQARLSDQQIDQVIAYAQAADGVGGVRCYASPRQDDSGPLNGGFAIMVSGPAGRIFDAVKAAQKSGRTFTRADVTSEMAATTLTVVAYPEAPRQSGSGRHDAPRATAVVIRTGGPHQVVIRARHTETLPTTWQSTSGETVTGQGVQAVFEYQDFAKVHLGDFEIVVLSGQAESACTIGAAARASIK